MPVTHIERCRDVQVRAKRTLARLAPTITADSTERSIAQEAIRLLLQENLTATWYYTCPALVLLGSRSCLSISGKDYEPADEPVGQTNLVTVDLSPLDGSALGDCARSFCIESGTAVSAPQSADFRAGIEMEQRLHDAVKAFISPQTGMHELWAFANEMICSSGFENLDFMGNVGHNITLDRIARQFIEKENHCRLADAGMFTFEPHIRQAGGKWGFKHENIYLFGADARIEEL